jgi:hypothetical protein
MTRSRRGSADARTGPGSGRSCAVESLCEFEMQYDAYPARGTVLRAPRRRRAARWIAAAVAAAIGAAFWVGSSTQNDPARVAAGAERSSRATVQQAAAIAVREDYGWMLDPTPSLTAATPASRRAFPPTRASGRSLRSRTRLRNLAPHPRSRSRPGRASRRGTWQRSSPLHPYPSPCRALPTFAPRRCRSPHRRQAPPSRGPSRSRLCPRRPRTTAPSSRSCSGCNRPRAPRSATPRWGGTPSRRRPTPG